MRLSLLISSALGAPKTELMDILASLRDISATVNQLDMANHVDLPDLSRLSKWKQNFDETAEHGATSKFVRELEAIGRKLKLPLINASMYKVDAKSFDLRKLSGYGCFGSTIDRDAKWSPKGTPVDEIDHLGYKLHSCYRCAQLDTEDQCNGDKPYRYTYSADNGMECHEEEGTCKLTLCQCDREYLMELEDVLDKFDPNNHILGGFDRKDKCAPKHHSDPDMARTMKDHECCGTGLDRAVYKPATFDCCEDGTVAPIGEC